MKKLIVLLLIVVLLFSLLTSCSKKSDIENVEYFEYPDRYTEQYCNINYVCADRYLQVGGIFENYIGESEEDSFATGNKYYGIEDTPLDRYLVLKEDTLDSDITKGLMINKAVALPKQEILTYEIERIEIGYYTAISHTIDGKTGREKNVWFSLDKDEAAEFQSALNEFIDSGGYKYIFRSEVKERTERATTKRSKPIFFNIYFSGYKNLYWSSYLEVFSRVEGEYYLDLCLYHNYCTDNQNWKNIKYPLPEELSSRIFEQIEE